MARAGFSQADIAALIEGKHAHATYIPQPDIEGAIKLALGKEYTRQR